MTISKITDGTTTVLAIAGWMDTKNSSLLGDEISALGKETEKLVLDMKDLEYISSSGIRQIIAAYKKMNGALVLRRVSAEILDVLNMTGVIKRLTIEE